MRVACGVCLSRIMNQMGEDERYPTASSFRHSCLFPLSCFFHLLAPRIPAKYYVCVSLVSFLPAAGRLASHLPISLWNKCMLTYVRVCVIPNPPKLIDALMLREWMGRVSASACDASSSRASSLSRLSLLTIDRSPFLASFCPDKKYMCIGFLRKIPVSSS